MSGALSYQRVKEQLESLKLHAALVELDGVLERAQQDERLPVEVLDELFSHELRHRFERRISANLQLSGLPCQKRLEDYDFDAQPQVPRRTLEELATLRFLHNGENVLLLGPCGVGKTHLAIGLALKALEHGHRVYFLTLHDLITKIRLAREKNRLHTLQATILRTTLFVLDELGFLPLSQEDATFLFELINKRYLARKSTIITSNKSYGQWGDVFPDPVLAVALLDRLLHHATTINIRGESYRLKHRREAGLTTA
ncbi:MAG: IS21-like element helper ATPase IstB [Dethiobacter sp.]|nr:IS21-like element helper ATPase IstB [Dethiobacter sp.]